MSKVIMRLGRPSERRHAALLVAAAMLFQLMLASVHAASMFTQALAHGDKLGLTGLCSPSGQQQGPWHRHPSLPLDPGKCPLCQHQLHVTGLPTVAPGLPRQHSAIVAAVAPAEMAPAALPSRLQRPEPRAPPAPT